MTCARQSSITEYANDIICLLRGCRRLTGMHRHMLRSDRRWYSSDTSLVQQPGQWFSTRMSKHA